MVLPSPGRFRVKEQREAARAQQHGLQLSEVHEHQRKEQAECFHARWRSLRALYASTTEFTWSQRSNTESSAGKLVPIPPISPSSTSVVTMWVRDLAIECRRAFANPLVTFPQLEVAFRKALRLNAAPFKPSSTTSSLVTILRQLRTVFRAFAAGSHSQAKEKEEKADFRELLSALTVLERWRDGERRLLMLWFDEFSSFSSRSTAAIRATDAFRVLSAASEDAQDEMVIRAIFNDLLASIGVHVEVDNGGTDSSRAAGKLVSETHFAAFIGAYRPAASDSRQWDTDIDDCQTRTRRCSSRSSSSAGSD